MRAHQIMTRKLITIQADTPILEAASLMLKHHVSGGRGNLPWIMCGSKVAKVGEIMTRDDLITATEDMPLEELVRLMGRQNVNRVPVVRGDKLVGIVTRTDLLRAVASLAWDVPDPTADDDHIRSRVIASVEKNEWQPIQFGVTVRDGIVHLSGMITDERFRQAAIVAAENVSGVKQVHDYLYFFDAMSGLSFRSPEDEGWAKAG